MPPPPVASGTPDISTSSLNWWQSILLAGSSALLGVLSVVMAQSGTGGPPKPQVFFRYIPHFLLLFGILADAFTYQGVYWTSTVIGIAGYFGGGILDTVFGGIAGLMGKAYARAGGTPAAAVQPTPIPVTGVYDGCTFGGGSATTVAVPPTLVTSASVMSYYLIDNIANHGFVSAVGGIFAFIALYGAHVSSIIGCMTDVTKGALGGLVYGLIVAGVCYSILQSFGPNYLPSSIVNAGGSGGPSGLVSSTPGSGNPPTACTGANCP
jgi:hypothetical protein